MWSATPPSLKIQGLWRRSLVRERTYLELKAVWEKIFDPVQQIYYYYNTVTDEASWKRPAPLLWRDLGDVAPTFTDEQAAIYMQCAWRRLKFLRTVRRLVASVVSKVYDEHSQNYYYYNAQTGQTSWTKPLLLGSQDIEPGTQRLVSSDGRILAETAVVELESDDDSERESIGSGSTRRRTRSMSSDDLGLMPREYPRSEAQKRIDKAEDTPETDTLDLSGLKMARISFRALAIETLDTLRRVGQQHLAPRAGHRGLSFPRKARCVGQPTTISTERAGRVRGVNMVRLCSQQNRLVPGQCLSTRTAPVLGPVTKSIPRITSPGRRPGTPPANASLGRGTRHAFGTDPLRCVQKSTDQVAEPTGPTTTISFVECPRRGVSKRT